MQFRFVPHHNSAAIVIPHHAREQRPSRFIRDDTRPALIAHRNQAVGGSEIDTDGGCSV